MAVFDACVFVSLFVEKDRYHKKARGLLGQRKSAFGAIHLPVIALAEVSGAIARVTGDSALAEDCVNALVGEEINFHDISFARAIRIARVASKLHLRGYDSVYVDLAHELKVPLITFDEEVLKKASRYFSLPVC